VKNSNYILITDGAYSSARNQGGYAFIFLKDDKPILQFSKAVLNTTNNKMELSAIIAGLRAIKGEISSLLIVSDSMYCVGCATLDWKRKKNQKLWDLFDAEIERVKKLCSSIEFQHVKGHQRNDDTFTKWNNVVDKLAVAASQKIISDESI